MQLLAMLTMLIDHVGKAFFPDRIEWQVIGRIAFPLYAYCIVMGYHHTKNLKKYIIRLLIIALLSQYPYMLVFETVGMNVVGSLLISLIVLAALDRYKGLIQVLLIISAAGLLLEGLDFSYGIYGLFLVLLYRYSSKHVLVLLHFVLNFIFMYINGWVLGMYNIISTVMIVYLPLFLAYMEQIRIPRWLWRCFYPAHLAILALLLLIK